jgi:serine/threonine-protein kinase
MQIANAVEFAHSKGIVHRDLKPDNVMIGEYGEVYLVDWGIALEVASAQDDKTPEFSDVIAGTPSYMAPEMVRGDMRNIGPRTDVYLLGAMLHELLTGHPPHTGNFHLTLLSALLSAPKTYEAQVPEGLAAIANKAMSADQGSRYASAGEFRSAILAYLRHRGSVQLAQEAGDSLRRLRMLLAVEHAGGTQVDVFAVYKLFGECRFGFQNALKAHEGNEPAREQFEVCLRLMAEYELRRRDAKAARLLLAEMRVVPEELDAQVSELEQESQRQTTELSVLRAQVQEADPNVQLHSRANLATVVGLGFNVVFAAWSYPNGRGMGHVGMTLFAALFAVAVAVSIYVWRKVVLANKANRRLARTLLVTVVAVFVNRLAGLRSNAPLEATLVGDLVLLALAGGSVAVTIDRRFGIVSAFLAVAAVVIAGFPQQAFFLFSASTTVGLLTLVWLWRKPARPAS